MELTKEEMIEKLRSVESEKTQYIALEAKLNAMEINNAYYEQDAADKLYGGPDFLDNLKGILWGFAFFFVSYYIVFTVFDYNNLLLHMILGVIFGFIMRYVSHGKRILKKRSKIIHDFSPEFQELKRNADDLSQQMCDKIGFLDISYCYPFAIDELERIFRSGRADTLKEGLKELEEAIHRKTMEETATKNI